MNNRKIFTSESVTQGHPDKLCDLVSDSVLDAVLEQDPMGRVACETAATTGMVLVMGEITTSARIDIAQIARKAICDAGYDRPEMGFDGHSCNVMVAMGRQSPDIAMGVDNAYDDGTTGAGDQGMMFGFACTQTKELMPAPIAYAHNLTKALTHARESGLLPWLRPDGKSQVSVEYGPDGMPARIDTVVVSTQHADSIAIDDLRKAVIETVIEPNLPSRLLDENTKYYVNPTGRFVIGGPAGDSGLTGRKIIVDTYGGYAAHGGGGHCIAVDPWFIHEKFEEITPLIYEARLVNDGKPAWTADRIARDVKPGAKIAVLGMSFKANIDDTRESPSVLFANILKSRGYEVLACEPYIQGDVAGYHNFSLAEAMAQCDYAVITLMHNVFKENKALIASRPYYDCVGLMEQ